MKKGSGWVWFVVAPFSLVVSTAFAGAFDGPDGTTAQLSWDGFSNSFVQTSISTDSGGSFITIAAGQFQGYFDGDQNGIAADDFFRFFCSDASQFADTSATPNPYTRLEVPGLGSADFTASEIAELTRLFNLAYPNPLTATYYAGGAQTNFGDFIDADHSAAFQIAVLEILYDTDMNLSTGTFQASSSDSAMINLAQGWLMTVGPGGSPAPGWTLFEFTSPTLQNFISVETSPPLLVLPAPEPGTLVLVAAAGLALITAMRRRQTA